jgi:glycosyltransferase involved in cell wall biosynthesis
MYTPMLGGAETYLKDLLWNVDRNRFETVFFYEAWPDFEKFLDLSSCPAITLRPVNVIEPSGHTHVNQSGPVRGATNSGNGVSGGSRARSVKRTLKRVYRSTPFGLTVAVQGLKWLNYSLWRANETSLRAAFRQTPVDVLHIVNGGYPGATTARIAAVVARELTIPCIMTICSTPSAPGFPRGLERRIDELVFESVNTFVLPADLPGQALVEHRGFRANKFHKIYFGVQAPELAADRGERASQVRADFGIKSNAFVIGTVSRFSRLKGQEHFIDALSLLRGKIPNLHGVLVGDGPTQKEIKARAAEKCVSDIATFMGFYDDVFAAITAFDVFVLPSELEGVPYVLLQAMSQAKPVVATSVGGIPEVVIDGETGLLISPRCPDSLAQAITKLSQNREICTRLGWRGHQRFKQNFTVSKMVKEHESLYERHAPINNRSA